MKQTKTSTCLRLNFHFGDFAGREETAKKELDDCDDNNDGEDDGDDNYDDDDDDDDDQGQRSQWCAVFAFTPFTSHFIPPCFRFQRPRCVTCLHKVILSSPPFCFLPWDVFLLFFQ